jgi:hypothetical protein
LASKSVFIGEEKANKKTRLKKFSRQGESTC